MIGDWLSPKSRRRSISIASSEAFAENRSHLPHPAQMYRRIRSIHRQFPQTTVVASVWINWLERDLKSGRHFPEKSSVKTKFEKRDSRALLKLSRSKQAFLGCPTNTCLDSFVFAEFFSKTGKATPAFARACFGKLYSRARPYAPTSPFSQNMPLSYFRLETSSSDLSLAQL